MGVESCQMKRKKRIPIPKSRIVTPSYPIPTTEEFERVSRMMTERYRGLDDIREAVLKEVCKPCLLHYFYIMPQGEMEFKAYVFFVDNKGLASSEKNGVRIRIEDIIWSELERVGKGARDTICVIFEFDSDENVRKKYGGYFNRLR
jgi:hypothetical protein